MLQLPGGLVLHALGGGRTAVVDDIILAQSSPVFLLIACFLAMPVASWITGERRMRVVETVSVAAVVLLFSLLLLTLLGSAGPSTDTSRFAPLQPGSPSPAARSSPSASAPASPTAPAPASPTAPAPASSPPPASSSTAAPRGRAPTPAPRVAGVPSPVPVPNAVLRLGTNERRAYGSADVAALLAAVYTFPPFYRRLLMRPARPPRSPRR